MELHSLVTDSDITIWWDKEGVNVSEYEVSIDGNISRTNKTHYTWDNLNADTEYNIEVKAYLSDKEIENVEESVKESSIKESSIKESSIKVRTSKTKRKIDITKEPYNAVGGGKTMNTAVIQKAFDDCGKGDQIFFPKGDYMTGALRLHSDMEIYLDEGAILHGTADFHDYLPMIKSRFEGIENMSYSSLLNAGELDHNSGPNCSNILIRGKGEIRSGGQKLGMAIIEDETHKQKEYLESLGDKIKEYETDHTIQGRVRPRLINLSNCSNVRITGVTLSDGACWNVHMIYCDDIVTDHVTINSYGVWNGDGWDPDSSTNCTLFATVFNTGDDGVAIKSGKNPEGNIVNRPSEHIRVFDCVSKMGHGICIGSEMSGGVSDVRIWDCDLSDSWCGIEIKGTKKRGAYVRDIHVSDCHTSRILMHSVLYNDDGERVSPHPPVFENCLFERVYIQGHYTDQHDFEGGGIKESPAIELYGFDEEGYEIKNLKFKDIVIEDRKVQSICMQHCKGISFESISFK